MLEKLMKNRQTVDPMNFVGSWMVNVVCVVVSQLFERDRVHHVKGVGNLDAGRAGSCWRLFGSEPFPRSTSTLWHLYRHGRITQDFLCSLVFGDQEYFETPKLFFLSHYTSEAS